MRVAIVTESFLPSANGVTTSVAHVLDHLRRRGHEALVICPGPAPQEYAGFPVLAVPGVTFRGFRVGMPAAALVRAIDEFRPDVLHAAAPFGLGYQALVVAQRRGIPTVALFQTDVAGFARRQKLGAASPAIWAWLRTVHSHADLTLAPSTATIAELVENGIERVDHWGRGVDARTYHPRRRGTKAVRALRRWVLRDAGPDAVVVGYVGRLAPEKEVERLRYLTADPRVRLLVVGDGPARRHLENLLKPMGALFTGKLTGPELADAYATLDVFVHTGAHETFGQTLQEAMATGLPVVAPAAGGPLDVVAEGESGYLFAPGDDAALARTVSVLAGDPAMRARMGEAGRRSVQPRSWQVLGDQLIEHYAATAARALV